MPSLKYRDPADGQFKYYMPGTIGPAGPEGPPGIDGVDGAARSVDVQAFTTPGIFTWTKPAGAKQVRIQCIAGGQGGGSGRRGLAGTIRGGGGGGGGGGYSEAIYHADQLTATMNVSVANGGTGGAAITIDNTNGNSGNNAGMSYVHDLPNTTYFCAANGHPGVWPGGGTVSGGVPGVGGQGMYRGGAGGAASATGLVGGKPSKEIIIGTYDYISVGGAIGGGAGGGISSANVVAGGGASEVWQGRWGSVGAYGGAASGNPGYDASVVDPIASLLSAIPGGGGGGGGASITTAAGKGGNGIRGGGGGGGGASLNGFASGAGGNGGDGIVVITTYF